MKEVEILIEVKDNKEKALEILSRFESHGIKKVLDIYFFDPRKDDLKPNAEGRLQRAFRIRQKGDAVSMAYKIDHFEGDIWSHSDEFETEVGNFEKLVHIIKHLGFEELVRVENEKHIFTTTEYEIVLEDVKNLGLFLEAEKLGDVSDEKVQETKSEIRNFLNRLGIKFGEEQNAGKPELLLRKNKTI